MKGTRSPCRGSGTCLPVRFSHQSSETSETGNLPTNPSESCRHRHRQFERRGRLLPVRSERSTEHTGRGGNVTRINVGKGVGTVDGGGRVRPDASAHTGPRSTSSRPVPDVDRPTPAPTLLGHSGLTKTQEACPVVSVGVSSVGLMSFRTLLIMFFVSLTGREDWTPSCQGRSGL